MREQARRSSASSSTRARDLAMIAVQGPNARAKVGAAAAGRASRRARSRSTFSSAATLGSMFVARTGYTGEDGFEIMLPAARRAALWRALDARRASKPCGLGARDTLRLEAGMNLYGNDMDETTTPLESGLALDGGAREPRRAISSAARRWRRRRPRGAAAQVRRRCCSKTAACCAATRKSSCTAPARARSPAARFRRRWSARSRSRACRAPPAPRAGRHSRQAARRARGASRRSCVTARCIGCARYDSNSASIRGDAP